MDSLSATLTVLPTQRMRLSRWSESVYTSLSAPTVAVRLPGLLWPCSLSFDDRCVPRSDVTRTRRSQLLLHCWSVEHGAQTGVDEPCHGQVAGLRQPVQRWDQVGIDLGSIHDLVSSLSLQLP
jgi:hypothetical protein